MGINIALIPLASTIPGKEVSLTVVTGNTMLNEQISKPYQQSARKSDECAVFQSVTCVLSKASQTAPSDGTRGCSDPDQAQTGRLEQETSCALVQINTLQAKGLGLSGKGGNFKARRDYYVNDYSIRGFD